MGKANQELQQTKPGAAANLELQQTKPGAAAKHTCVSTPPQLYSVSHHLTLDIFGAMRM